MISWAPGDWTTEKDGKKYGIDQQRIYIGDVSIPTSILALLPVNRGRNAQTNVYAAERAARRGIESDPESTFSFWGRGLHGDGAGSVGGARVVIGEGLAVGAELEVEFAGHPGESFRAGRRGRADVAAPLPSRDCRDGARVPPHLRPAG